MSTDLVMGRLSAADPARGFEPDRDAAERLLGRIVSSPATGQAGSTASTTTTPPARRRAVALAFACLLALLLAAAALAAVGVIHLGAPARPSGSLANPRYGLGALTPGTARVLPVAASDPAGGPPWGMRVLSTTRGVGCVEVGRLLGSRLGVLGRDGAFGDDGRFHPLPAGGLANGGQCANLDANGRLFYTVSAYDLPASGWHSAGSCIVAPEIGAIYPPPRGGFCGARELRDFYYGLLGPEATSLTYRLGGRRHTLKPVGPDGAYLIVALRSQGFRHHGHFIGGAIGSIMPLPWSSPIQSITYRNGEVCRIAATQPGTFKGQCTPPGYTPARAPNLTATQVAAPIQAVVVPGSGATGRHPAIRVSFTARVAITSASMSYELVEDSSTPEATFVATQGDVKAGQTLSWLLAAPRPGVYSGKVVLGVRGAPPYPIYTYSPGPLVGRFHVRVP